MKVLLCIVFFFVQAFVCIGQNVEFSKNNFVGKKAELKEALNNIKKGDASYKFGPKMYNKALEYYLSANQLNPSNALLNFKIGTCYLSSPFKNNANTYLEKALKLDPNVDSKLNLTLGISYHLNMQWNAAIAQFEIYKKSIKADDLETLKEVNKKIDECKNGVDLMKDTLRFNKLPDSLKYRIENMGANINSPYGDYHPVISADESVLIFTSRRSNTTGGGLAEDGKYYEDIYISNNENGKWSEAKNLSESINRSNQHDASCGISVDGQTLFVYLDDLYDGTGNIYECKLNGHDWSTAIRMPRSINSKYHESSASLSPDGQTLYFCSQNPLNNKGIGKHDIFKVQRITLDGKSQWSEPENLGDVINTEYGEQTVFIHPDGKTLYFSSEGHNTMGGYDLFKSVYNDSLKKWSKPVNLGYPINSPDDELDFVMAANGKHAYYATIRADGLGEKDIYRITLPADTTPQLTLVRGNVMDESKNAVGAKIEIIDKKSGKIISTQESNSATGKFLVSLPSGKNYKMNVTSDGYYAEEKEFNIPKGEKFTELDVNVIMKRKAQLVSLEGDILDENGKPIVGTIEIINNATGEVILKTTTDKLGKYLSKLQAGKNYGIVVSSDGYLFQSVNLDIPPDKDRIQIPPIKLKKIEAGKNIVLNNIFFDFDKATLRADSKSELDRVSKVLRENPSMKIEISGHTDSKGSAIYNLKLSEERAKSVVDYLINIGIDKHRLSFKGYGFLKPLATNKTEEGRQQNRRTEFKVLEIDALARPIKLEEETISTKLPANIQYADNNKDGKISADEIIFVIENFFDGESDYTFEKINHLIDFFFEFE